MVEAEGYFSSPRPPEAPPSSGKELGGSLPADTVDGQPQFADLADDDSLTHRRALVLLVPQLLAAAEKGSLAPADVQIALREVHSLITEHGLQVEHCGKASSDLLLALQMLDEFVT